MPSFVGKFFIALQRHKVQFSERSAMKGEEPQVKIKKDKISQPWSQSNIVMPEKIRPEESAHVNENVSKKVFKRLYITRFTGY